MAIYWLGNKYTEISHWSCSDDDLQGSWDLEVMDISWILFWGSGDGIIIVSRTHNGNLLVSDTISGPPSMPMTHPVCLLCPFGLVIMLVMMSCHPWWRCQPQFSQYRFDQACIRPTVRLIPLRSDVDFYDHPHHHHLHPTVVVQVLGDTFAACSQNILAGC